MGWLCRNRFMAYRRDTLIALPHRRNVVTISLFQNGDGGGVGGGRGGVFKAQIEGGRSFLNLFVFTNVRVAGISGAREGMRQAMVHYIRAIPCSRAKWHRTSSRKGWIK